MIGHQSNVEVSTISLYFISTHFLCKNAYNLAEPEDVSYLSPYIFLNFGASLSLNVLIKMVLTK